MRLTWKDGVTTAVIALVVTVYLLFVTGVDVVFLSDARGAATAILLLGMVGCGYGAADELFKVAKSTARRAYTVVASTVGVTALIAGLIALIFGSEVALAVLFATTVALWLLATTRHIANTCKASPATGSVIGNVTEPRKEARSR